MASNLSLAWSNPNATTPAPIEDDGEGMALADLRKQFTDFVTVKQDELDEQLLAWNFFHGKQWTDEQERILKERGQIPITFNLLAKKVDGLVGIINRQRGEPKAFGRTQQGEPGAEIATQCVRYVLDASMFDVEDEEATRQAMVGGIAVFEIREVPGDMGDPDYEVGTVDARMFFYDHKSLKADFSDARYLGVSTMKSPDEIDELFPGMGDQVAADARDADVTPVDAERENVWYGQASSDKTRTVRLVEHWYRQRGEWRVAFYAANTLLWSGASTYLDDRGKTMPRILAYSAAVDVDGTRYGPVRNMRGPQEAINQHRSKAVHVMNARQFVYDKSAFGGDGDVTVEDMRREATRPDGVLGYNGMGRDKPPFTVLQFDQAFIQQTQYYQDAVTMIAQFGPNPALLAQNGGDVSGRALSIMQQAGMAELGRFLAARRGCKLRLYRAIWALVQRNWKSERIIRVTRDPNLSQYLAVNQLTVDQYGRPALVNVLGAINVDIIMDEGPDTVNVMGDVFDILSTLAQNKVPVPPAALIEASSLPASQKQKLTGILNQPDPAKDAMQQATVQKTQAQAQDLQASAVKKHADAQHSQALAAVDTVLAAHAHSDHLSQVARGGLSPDLPIDLMIQQRAAAAQQQAQVAEQQQMGAQPPQPPQQAPQPAPQQLQPDAMQPTVVDPRHPALQAARQAPDGHFYIPDMRRPGKFLRVG